MLAGDFNVMPTERDVYKPERWLDDALFAPETRAAWFRLVGQGWLDALRHDPSRRDDLHLLGLFPERLRAQRGPEDRPFPAQPAARRAAGRCASRPRGAGWDKTSDHAPVWIELADGKRKRR
jgi:exodeoxyribonuclease-3